MAKAVAQALDGSMINRNEGLQCMPAHCGKSRAELSLAKDKCGT